MLGTRPTKISLLLVTSLNCPLVRREVESLRPPPVQETFPVALTMGETGGSGRNLGLDGVAIIGFFRLIVNDFLGSLECPAHFRDQG